MYRLTQNQISSELAGETVILNHAAGMYYGLNEVGTFVWELLKQSPMSFEELKEQVMTNFEVDESTCTDDLQQLLNDLVHEKLVETV
ncbi:PqqD family protein [Spirosoma panaciterrae]|uniref:PqqD family protein n=1 Tax=Spirosoma panaciterrae TaxID=496058 RepID=UPI00036A6E83|nr:PqqD family protein [Spirosoma panaciterrae]